MSHSSCRFVTQSVTSSLSNCGPREDRKIQSLVIAASIVVSQITFLSGSVKFLSKNLCVTLSEISSADKLVLNIFGEEFLK